MNKSKSPIARLRLRAGLKQIDLALAIGVRSQTISNWEMGRDVPTLPFSRLEALTKALKCSVEDLGRIYIHDSIEEFQRFVKSL